MMNLEQKFLEADQAIQQHQTSSNLRYNSFQTSSIANYVTTATGDTNAICDIIKNNTVIIEEDA